jgi:molecular chaperone GrpE
MENGKSAHEAVPAEELANDTAVAADDLAAKLEAIAGERDMLAAQVADLNDRLLRRIAEFDNFRKRSERERYDLLETAGIDVAQALLPVLDDFERALQIETTDKDYARGVELIYGRLVESLQKQGLEPIEATGQPFDPNIHEAIETVPTTEQADHTVLADLRRGYRFRGRLLRASMVRVAVQP